MMPLLRKFLEKIKQLNKEYLFLFFIICLVIFMIRSVTSMSQGMPTEITLSTLYPSPFGEYNELRVKRVEDYENANYWLDPAGVSVLRDINIGIAGQAGARILMDGNNSAIFGNVALPGGGAKAHIKLNSTSIADPSIYVHSIQTTDRITMGAATPPNVVAGVPVGGKHVYDIAEGMPVKDCQAGDVVVIGDTEGISLVRSEKSFSTNVAGVISTDPKLYMGPGEGKMPLALAGIVLCKVTTENGSINRGDLLVSASVPGHAMRADSGEIKPGMLIGKSLQKFAGEKGSIYILVNKQ